MCQRFAESRHAAVLLFYWYDIAVVDLEALFLFAQVTRMFLLDDRLVSSQVQVKFIEQQRAWTGRL